MKLKSCLSAAALAVSALCASAPASAAIIFSFSPSSSHINIGDSVVVDVSISGLGDEILSSLDINFFFNGTAATNTAGDFNSLVAALGGIGNSVTELDPLNGSEVGLVAYSLLEDAPLALQQANSFSLGSFTFFGNANGVTTISLGDDPAFERNFVGLNFETLGVTVGSACIAVGTGSCAAVPEPASLALLGIGLAGLGYSRRRKS